MLKNKKIIFVILFFAAFLLLMSSNSFASVDFEHNGTSYSVPDLPLGNNRIYFMGLKNNVVYLFQPNYSVEEYVSKMSLDTSRTYKYFLMNEDSSQNVISIAVCYYENGNYYYYDKLQKNSIINEYLTVEYYIGNDGNWAYSRRADEFASIKYGGEIINSLENIYYFGDTTLSQGDLFDTSSDNVFFQATSIVEEPEEIPEEPTQETTLKRTFKTIPLAGVQQEIIQILPLIIVVVVSLVGLRKGLKLLLTLLRKA